MSAVAEPPRNLRPLEDNRDFTPPMIVRLRPQTRLDDAALIEFCADNSELRIEQNAQGDLIIMAPAFSESGWQNAELTADFVAWARRAGGRVFDSSSGFKLPNGALRSPDVSWISQARLDGLTPEGWREFISLCPDFVLELRSRSDRLATLQQKMAEYMANGARLGWLIDPAGRQVFVYQPDHAPICLEAPNEVDGGEVLAAFTLEVSRFWSSPRG